MMWCVRFAVFGVLAGAFISVVFAAEPEQDKINTQVEALTRLQNVNLEEKPQIKAALGRVLDRTRGTPNFVRLVRHFKLTNENAGLMEVAVKEPESELGVEAIRLVLAAQDWAVIETAVMSTNATTAARAVTALGNAKEKQAVPPLQRLVENESRPMEVRRAAVRGLTQTEEGAVSLLAMARSDKLPDRLKLAASSDLSSVRWAAIKTAAGKLLPPPVAQDSEPLPPITELAKRTGSAPRGAKVYRRETTGCIKCHQVGHEGRDVGPALTEIGTKLAREALYEAILDPSAGISFGYEAFQVELKSGDEAYGLKANDTPDEVAIKDTNGLVTRYKKSEITSMRQGTTSIMPTGLQQAMTVEDLVDLIEYLASLKKTGP